MLRLMQARHEFECYFSSCLMGVLALQVDDLRGSPMSVGNLEEIIDEKSVICSMATLVHVQHIPCASILTCSFLAVMPSCHPPWDQSTMSAYFPL